MELEGTSVIIAVITLALLSIFIIGLIIMFQKRKNELLLKQQEADQRYENEIAMMQIEIREEIFRNISWELHDNVGQLLTLAKIQLQDADKVKDARKTLDNCLKELRILSKAMNPDAIKKMSLREALEQEIGRLNRLNFLNASLEINGKEREINDEHEIILYRILQEFLSNTIRHAKATELKVGLNFMDLELKIIAKDNGRGFDAANVKSEGIGLINIKKRAALINAKLDLNSKKNIGTLLEIDYTY